MEKEHVETGKKHPTSHVTGKIRTSSAKPQSQDKGQCDDENMNGQHQKKTMRNKHQVISRKSERNLQDATFPLPKPPHLVDGQATIQRMAWKY